VDQAGADILFKSLGDPSRRQVARILAEAALTVGEIAEVLGLPQSTVSRHLKSLRATGLLVDRRDGARTYIGLTRPATNGSGGHDDLDRMLNVWLRSQPLPGVVASRLERVVRDRNGDGDSFESLAHQWDELRFEHFGSAFHLEALASLLPSHWRVLDAGTGTGYLLPFLGSHFQDVIAADSSPAMLDLARKRTARAGLRNVEFRLGRLEALPLDDQSIDCAIVILVLRHSTDLQRSLSELARVVVGGGRLLVVDIGLHSMEEFRRRIGDSSMGLDPGSVARVAGNVGFEVACRRVLSLPEVGGADPPTRPAPDLFLITATRRQRPAGPNRGSD
jgi:ubiquinone/menaquinone biosynthesis C-methylase UbiE/DNA-binding transcriptional ArsR family regulator